MTNPPSNFSIIECTVASADIWNSFSKGASGTYCHLFSWKQVFERAYGLQTHYLAFCSGDTWLGVMPIAVMPRLPGRAAKAVSLPYCNYGGLLAAQGVDEEILKAEAVKYLHRMGINRIEFREVVPDVVDSPEVTMVLRLAENPGFLWKQLGVKVRNQIRKAQRSGLTLRWGKDQADDLYAIYAKNMGRLGTPVHSPKFIGEILFCLGEQADVLTVRHEGRAVGAMLVIKHGNTWADPIASCLTEFNSLNPNMLLYWEALRAACDAGAATFDFGRSHKDSGTYRFKKQWGAAEVSLHYHIYEDGVVLPLVSTKFYRGQRASKLASIWQKLPSFVQMRFGPLVRRWLP